MLTLDYDRLGVGSGDLVLDVGTGLGRHSYEVLRRGGRAVALDLFDTDGLRSVQDNFGILHDDGLPKTAHGSAVNADTLSLPFADATFDRVIASEVLEHIPDDVHAMSEIARVTKPGGSVAVTVPRFGQELVCWTLSREYHDNPGGHVRIYRQRQVTERLQRVGLEPRGLGYAHALHTPYWWLRCLVGPTKETNPLVRAYKSFLEWDITKGPIAVRAAERVLNPVLGKSLVVYATKTEAAGA